MEKLYKEAFDNIKAKDDAVDNVLQAISAGTAQKHSRKTLKRVLIAALCLVVVFGGTGMAGEFLGYSGYVHDASFASIKAEGFDFPEKLGEYTATDFARIDTVSSDADAGFNKYDEEVFEFMHLTSANRASYQWHSISYTIGDLYVWMEKEYEEGIARWNEFNPDYKVITIDFGKTDDDLWKYTFGFTEDGIFDLDKYIEHVYAVIPSLEGQKKCFDFEKEIYKGITLCKYTEETLYEWSVKRIDYEKEVKEIRNVECIRWVDEKNGIVYSANFGVMSRDAATEYAKIIIDRINP